MVSFSLYATGSTERDKDSGTWPSCQAECWSCTAAAGVPMLHVFPSNLVTSLLMLFTVAGPCMVR